MGRLEGSTKLVGLVLLFVGWLTGLILAMIDPITLFLYTSYATVGAYLVARRPRSVIGWLLILIGVGFFATSTPEDLDVAALEAGTAGLRDTVAAWVLAWAGLAGLFGYLALTLLFPTGRLPADRWRPLSIATLAIGATFALLAAVAPTITFNLFDSGTVVVVANPLAIAPGLPLWDLVAVELLTLPMLVLIGYALLRMVVRYRSSVGLMRLQFRWLLAAIAATVFALVFGLIVAAAADGEAGLIGWLPALVAYPTVPLAIGIAVLRYRLFEIDRIISRTISWAIVTGALAIVFGAVVVGLQAVLSDVTQGETLAIAASTLVAFALFQPLRRRVQRMVDRRFHRAAYDTERITHAFAARLRDQVDLDVLRDELTATIDATMRPMTSGLWLRSAAQATSSVTDTERGPATTRA